MKVRFGDWPIRRKAAAALALAMLPLVLALSVQATLAVQIQKVDKQLPIARENRTRQTELLKLLLDAETGTRGYLLTKDDAYLAPYDEAISEVPELVRSIQTYEERLDVSESFEPITDLINQKLQLMAVLIAEGFEDGRLERAKSTMDRLRVLIAVEQDEEDAQILSLVERRETLFRQQTIWLVAALAAALLGAAVSGWLLLKKIIVRIQKVKLNAQRLVSGEPLLEVSGGNDEVGSLAADLATAANLLRARESELRQAKAEADRANAAKSDFLSRMSHELRTPLNAILGFARLARNEVSEAVKHDIDEIQLAGQHLLDLINEVLDISMIESGKLSFSVETVRTKDVIDEAVSLVTPLANGRSIVVSTDGDACAASWVKADRQRLKQVMVNLLSNAVKYNRDGGKVSISCSCTEGWWTLGVTDTGGGLPDSAADTLFTPFARLGAEMTSIEGTGLGLALSKTLVEAMGGELFVGSTGKEGTQFCIRLQASVEVDLSHLPALASPGLPDSLHPASLATILQIEDNASNIRLVSRVMQRRPNVELISTESGLEGIELARAILPDLVLLDLNLPDISGRDVLIRLKADPITRAIPIVMLSADASPPQITKLLETGASHYLTKPIDVRALLELVDEMLHEEVVA